MHKVKPVYETLPGWGVEIEAAGRLEELPPHAREYVKFVEDFVGVHVSIVGVGPARDQTIVLPAPRRVERERRAFSSSAVAGASTRSRGALARSPHVDEVVCAPGNPGMATLGECVPVAATDPGGGRRPRGQARRRPRGRRARGSAGRGGRRRGDRRRVASRSARTRPRPELEGSKAWMKDVLVAAGRPDRPLRARSARARKPGAFAFLETLPGLYVVKTDGLAAGKGVVVTESIAEARDAVRAYLSGAAFGDAGRTCVIEEGLTGPELSLFALCDGRRARGARRRAGPQARVRRRRRARTRAAWARTRRCRSSGRRGRRDDGATRSLPTLAELERRGAPFRGVLCTAGSCSRPTGPKVLEYNVRFGDPECQVLVPRLASDLFVHLSESAAGDARDPDRAGRASRASASCSRPRAIRPRPTARATSSHGLDRAGRARGRRGVPRRDRARRRRPGRDQRRSRARP